MQRVFTLDGQLSVPTEPSVEALLEEVAGLVDAVCSFNRYNPLIQMWFAVNPGAKDEAYRNAQRIYGLPDVADEEREKPHGLVFFWSRIRDLLESELDRLRQTVEPCAHPFLVTMPHREGGGEPNGDFISPGEGPYDPLAMHPFAE